MSRPTDPRRAPSWRDPLRLALGGLLLPDLLHEEANLLTVVEGALFRGDVSGTARERIERACRRAARCVDSMRALLLPHADPVTRLGAVEEIGGLAARRRGGAVEISTERVEAGATEGFARLTGSILVAVGWLVRALPPGERLGRIRIAVTRGGRAAELHWRLADGRPFVPDEPDWLVDVLAASSVAADLSIPGEEVSLRLAVLGSAEPPQGP